MSKQNNISKKGAKRQQDKLKSPKAKRNASSKKSQEIQITQFTIAVGDTVYDVTDKKYDELLDELKAALEPAQRLYAKLMVKSMWRNFFSSLSSDLKDVYDAAS